MSRDSRALRPFAAAEDVRKFKTSCKKVLVVNKKRQMFPVLLFNFDVEFFGFTDTGTN